MPTVNLPDPLKCLQCGKELRDFNVFIVMARDELVVGSAIASNNRFMAHPVCDDCHKAPTLKGHFHYKSQLHVALAMAGGTDLKM